jgi:hypothetical protein
METATDATMAGFTFGVNVTEEGTVFDMLPIEPRQVTCDDLGAILAPHLTGALEVIVINSQSIALNDDGSTTSHAVRCSWGDYPGRKPGEAAPTPESQGSP